MKLNIDKIKHFLHIRGLTLTHLFTNTSLYPQQFRKLSPADALKSPEQRQKLGHIRSINNFQQWHLHELLEYLNKYPPIPSPKHLVDFMYKKGFNYTRLQKHLCHAPGPVGFGYNPQKFSLQNLYEKLHSKYPSQRKKIYYFLLAQPDFLIEDTKKHLFDTSYLKLRRIKKGQSIRQMVSVLGFRFRYEYTRIENSENITLKQENMVKNLLDNLPDAPYNRVVSLAVANGILPV